MDHLSVEFLLDPKMQDFQLGAWYPQGTESRFSGNTCVPAVGFTFAPQVLQPSHPQAWGKEGKGRQVDKPAGSVPCGVLFRQGSGICAPWCGLTRGVVLRIPGDSRAEPTHQDRKPGAQALVAEVASWVLES